MAVVPVMALAAWLIAVYLAARDTGGHKQATAGSQRTGARQVRATLLPEAPAGDAGWLANGPRWNPRALGLPSRVRRSWSSGDIWP